MVANENVLKSLHPPLQTMEMNAEWPSPMESAALVTPKKNNKRTASRKSTRSDGHESKHMSKTDMLTEYNIAAHNQHLISNLVCLLLTAHSSYLHPCPSGVARFNASTFYHSMSPCVHRTVAIADSQEGLWQEVDVTGDLKQLAINSDKTQDEQTKTKEVPPRTPDNTAPPEPKDTQPPQELKADNDSHATDRIMLTCVGNDKDFNPVDVGLRVGNLYSLVHLVTKLHLLSFSSLLLLVVGI